MYKVARHYMQYKYVFQVCDTFNLGHGHQHCPAPAGSSTMSKIHNVRKFEVPNYTFFFQEASPQLLLGWSDAKTSTNYF